MEVVVTEMEEGTEEEEEEEEEGEGQEVEEREGANNRITMSEDAMGDFQPPVFAKQLLSREKVENRGKGRNYVNDEKYWVSSADT